MFAFASPSEARLVQRYLRRLPPFTPRPVAQRIDWLRAAGIEDTRVLDSAQVEDAEGFFNAFFALSGREVSAFGERKAALVVVLEQLLDTEGDDLPEEARGVFTAIVARPTTGQTVAGNAGNNEAVPPREVVPSSSAGALEFLDRIALRRLLSSRLSRGDVAVVWFDTFGSPIDNDLPGASLNECVIALIERAEQRNRRAQMLESLKANRPDLQNG